jgi:hypothetical protein
MDHCFDLPVIYKGEEQTLKGRLAVFGYVYKFYILAAGQELIFEKDEEGQYRVFSGDSKKDAHIDPALIQAIIATLNELSA